MVWNEPKAPVTRRARAAAGTLRKTLTEPERRLWRHLRRRMPLDGTHFRRQVAVGPYVVDFCCLGTRLIVEIDGEQHGRPAGLAADARRDAALEAQGFHIPRFSNADIRRRIDVVLDTIRAAVYADPPSLPDPANDEGGEIVTP